MLESSHFTYNGISSKEMGVQLVSPNAGLYKESFLPNRKLIETKANGNPIPFFQRIDEDSFSLSFGIYIEDWDKRNQLRSIARWLYQDYHKPLILESNPDVVMYGMFIDKSELVHNGLKQGYITLNFKSKSPYLYSIPHKHIYNVNGNLREKFYNNGDKPLYFKMTLENKVRGDISILNEDENEEFLIKDVFENETVYVDCRSEYLVSSLEERLKRYLGDSHNDIWLVIPPETEVSLSFKGNFKVTFEYEYIYLAYDNEL